ncbi:pyrrolo-quinoline quinone [Aquincola sp. S2]|uniref:Pyrrolo-quinoline quinone n=1 Tax=Pseudaquabacterium terrae TaxID=2732868 RepID=A0ABX2EC54_9BURK|nr:PilC/PilY family type IV pilus protein [Aquabacterium terrae]NRF66146.1 pyrrolo-quinoline quinone [Aquabacterium terrae]
MTSALKFATAVLALGGLLFQATSHATNLAEQPLKASVLAKPNVIFAMDDSGSMDAEVLLKTYQGWYWSKNSSPGPFNGTALHNTSSKAFAYLFPNGVSPTTTPTTDNGIKIYSQANGSNAGHAIPPTAQFAWARSSEYNPIYYDTTKTYKPWSPAYISSGLTFSNATPTAAKSHPVLGSTTMNLTADISSTDDEWRFAFTYNMKIPAGATRLSTSTPYAVANACGSADSTYTGSSTCYGSISYYPATFWRKEDCGTVDDISCTTAYDGQKLKRYEIKSGNSFPSGRSYTDEMQNFANWFQYYRKRKMLMAGAAGAVLEDITGLRMGVVAFNNQATPTMYDADNSSAASNARKVAGIFYGAKVAGSTPTRGTYKYIYDKFDTDTNIIQYACQRNAAFIVTDGFANDGAPSMTGLPAATATDYGSTGAPKPYHTTPSGWLAHQGLAYFIRPLRASGGGALPAGKVPLGNQTVTNPDSNPNLHLNTYAITLGMTGEIWPANSTPFTTPPSWPTPVIDSAKMIDDLWHATINGRGQMYLATDVQSATIGIQTALSEIQSQTGAQTAVAVSTFNLLAGDGQAYEASYNPAGWTGDLTASAVSMTTGNIATAPTWSAASVLNARNWATRIVFTADGTVNGGRAFTEANIGATVNPDSVAFTNAGVVDYLRGKRTGEGSTYRTRLSLMGAVINAEQVIDSGVAYVASGEGMLHAFNTTTGAEEWAFVPYGALSSIGLTVERAYAFKTKLDGTPNVDKYTDAGGRLLVGGMGAAGRSYYALDVTNPKGLTEAQAAAQVKWTFPSPTQTAYQPYVGYTVGRPLIVKTADDGYVALVTSGYDNGSTIGDGKGRMWMLNASTGAVIREFVTPVGTTAAEAGLRQIAAYREDTGTARYVYGGDLLGNLWKFDLKLGTTTLVATFKDGAGNTQPVTTTPVLTEINGKPVIVVGTGRLLDITDFGSSNVQTIYAVRDTNASLSNARNSMAGLTHNLGTKVISGTIDWATQRGWYLDIPAGEQVNVDPKYALGYVFVNANAAGGSNCAQSASSYRIHVRAVSGKSEVLSTTNNVTASEIVQLKEGELIIWTRKPELDDRRPPIVKVFGQRKNAWRDIR